MASFINLAPLFGHTQTANCMGLGLTLHPANGQKDEAMGTPTGIVLHWTAGDYTGAWDDYHYNVAMDVTNKRACVMQCLRLDQKGQHLWGRNSGMIGISFCAMADHRFPVTDEQKEAAAHLIAELCYKFNLDPSRALQLPELKQVAGSLTRTGGLIHPLTVSDHADFAKHDGYYPDRWDIGSQEDAAHNLMVPLRKRAMELLGQLKAKTLQPMFGSLM